MLADAVEIAIEMSSHRCRVERGTIGEQPQHFPTQFVSERGEDFSWIEIVSHRILLFGKKYRITFLGAMGVRNKAAEFKNPEINAGSEKNVGFLIQLAE